MSVLAFRDWRMRGTVAASGCPANAGLHAFRPPAPCPSAAADAAGHTGGGQCAQAVRAVPRAHRRPAVREIPESNLYNDGMYGQM